jgi:hypothetical protein
MPELNVVVNAVVVRPGGQCYNHYIFPEICVRFRRKKLALYLKTNVFFSCLNSSTCLPIFWQSYFQNHNIGPSSHLTEEGLPEQVEEERQGVVQLHLLVRESHHEENRSQAVLVPDQADHGQDHQPKRNSVVLEVAMVD